MNSCRKGRLLNISFPLVNTPVSYFELPRLLLIGYFSGQLFLEPSGCKTFTNSSNILLVIRNSQRRRTTGVFEGFYLDIKVIPWDVLPLKAKSAELGIGFSCVTGFRLTFVDWRQVSSLRNFNWMLR